jgi:hypothetical protein
VDAVAGTNIDGIATIHNAPVASRRLEAGGFIPIADHRVRRSVSWSNSRHNWFDGMMKLRRSGVLQGSGTGRTV